MSSSPNNNMPPVLSALSILVKPTIAPGFPSVIFIIVSIIVSFKSNFGLAVGSSGINSVPNLPKPPPKENISFSCWRLAFTVSTSGISKSIPCSFAYCSKTFLASSSSKQMSLLDILLSKADILFFNASGVA